MSQIVKQKKDEKIFDKKVHPREFHEGDLVLKKILPIQRDHRGKWTPIYEGLYMGMWWRKHSPMGH